MGVVRVACGAFSGFGQFCEAQALRVSSCFGAIGTVAHWRQIKNQAKELTILVNLGIPTNFYSVGLGQDWRIFEHPQIPTE